MVAQQSRDFILKVTNSDSPETFTTVAGVMSKSLAGSNNLLDVTTDDDDGVRKLLAGKYGQAYEVSGTAKFKDEATFTTLRGFFEAGTSNNYQIVLPGSTANGTYEGAFIISAFTITGGGQDESIEVELTLASDGAITFT